MIGITQGQFTTHGLSALSVYQSHSCVSGPSAFYVAFYSYWVTMASSSCFIVLNWFADGLLVSALIDHHKFCSHVLARSSFIDSTLFSISTIGHSYFPA